jgi:hypothetical protein
MPNADRCRRYVRQKFVEDADGGEADDLDDDEEDL